MSLLLVGSLLSCDRVCCANDPQRCCLRGERSGKQGFPTTHIHDLSSLTMSPSSFADSTFPESDNDPNNPLSNHDVHPTQGEKNDSEKTMETEQPCEPSDIPPPYIIGNDVEDDADNNGDGKDNEAKEPVKGNSHNDKNIMGVFRMD